MSNPNIKNGDPIIYGSYQVSGITFEISGFAQEENITLTPIADSSEKKVGGKTVREAYEDPGIELSGDFVVAGGNHENLHPGAIVNILHPGESVPKKYVVQSAPAKFDSETGAVIVSLSARHRYSMATAYDAGPINPETGSPFSPLFRISGYVVSAETGAPVAGVSISDGTRSAVSDSAGRFEILDVPAGTFTLTPALADHSFIPAAISDVEVADDVVGKNFIAVAD